MTERSMIQQDIVNATNISKSTISKYFNETRGFPLDRANQFANIFGITPEYLLGVYPSEFDALTNVQKKVISHIDPDTPENEAQQIINFSENLKLSRAPKKTDNTTNIVDETDEAQQIINFNEKLKLSQASKKTQHVLRAADNGSEVTDSDLAALARAKKNGDTL
ncbi:helix-turn-helix domain-containing protein [Periweissella cryptocerci]|nr:helix-turn-helix transcriptional regulator [Periweissella cryptocerci]